MSDWGLDEQRPQPRGVEGLRARLNEPGVPLAEIVEDADEAATIIQDGLFRCANQQFHELFGYTGREMVGKAVEDYVTPDDLDLIAENYRQQLEGTRAPLPCRVWVTGNGGRRLWTEFTATPVTFQGRPADLGVVRPAPRHTEAVLFREVLESLHDVAYTGIARRRQAEEALRASEARYRALAESVSDVFFAMDRNLRYTYWNKASEEYSAIASEDAVGKSLYDLFPKVRGTEPEKAYLEALNTGRPQHFVHRFQHDGAETIFDISAYPSADGLTVIARDITERERASEAVRESEARYRTLFERTTNPVLVIHTDGNYLDANEAALGFLECTRRELLRKNVRDFLPAEDLEQVLREHERLWIEGGTVETTYLVRGKTKVMELSVTPGTQNGRPVVYGLGRDITRRREAETALQRQRDLAQAYLDIAGVMLVGIGADERVTLVNKRGCGVLGYSAEEIVGRNWFDTFLPDRTREEDRAVFREVMTGGIRLHERVENGLVVTSRGEERMVSWRNGLIADAEGKPVGTLSSGEDVTEQVGMRRALEESARRYRLIAESAGDVISLHRLPELAMTYVNPAAKRMLGYLPDELVGRSALDVVHPEDVQIVRRGVESVLAGAPEEVQMRVQRKDGSYVYVESSAGLVVEEDGTQLLLVVTRDITAQKASEEQLRQRADHLARQLAVRYDMVGASSAMQEVYEFIRKVAPSEAGVLVCGESGTGKEMVARAIHAHSLRKDGPLEIVNCAAVPSTLLEDELFGHARGAFTGAVSDKMGRFELANNGTLFLDEVAELPLDCQTKLLRAVEGKLVRRIGDTKDRAVDVRLVAATNRDVTQAVAEGRLRADLFYRLDRLRVQVPPLRDRADDIELLADHFLAQISSSCRREIRGFAPEVLRTLRAYEWPGNVRELRNVVERMVLLGEGTELELTDVPEDLRGPEPARTESLADVERKHVLRVLDKVGGNKKRAAQILGIDRTTLYARLKAYGLTK